MNLKRIFSYAFVAMTLVSTSCSKDDPKYPNDVGVNGGGGGDETVSGSVTELTPEESKTFLGNQAKSFMEKFRTSDQEGVIELASYFCTNYGDLKLPSNFNINEEISYPNSPAKVMRALERGLTRGSADDLIQATTVYTYNVNFKQFAGEYEPGISRWVKKKDSKDIIFRFTDSENNTCELKITASDSNSDLNFVENEFYEGWYGEDPEWDQYIYNISIPHDVKMTLTQSGRQLVNGQVSSKIDIEGHNANVDVTTTVANIVASARINATDSKISMNTEMKVSGEMLVRASAEVLGNHMCDLDAIMGASDEDDEIDGDTILQFIHSGTANIDLMGQIQLYGSGKLTDSVLKAFNDYEFEWGYGYLTKNEAEENVTKAITALNNNIKVVMKYQGTSTTQAQLIFKKSIYEYGQYGYYYFDPMILFPSDNTTYSFDEYFERGFGSVVDTWDSLINSYCKLWEKYNY